MREIITLQIGPFANWAGSHFWNVQDDARHPPSYDENGDPVYEDEQADTAILYRSSSGRSRQLTPRLVLCPCCGRSAGMTARRRSSAPWWRPVNRGKQC
jgi:hypothetical protein